MIKNIYVPSEYSSPNLVVAAIHVQRDDRLRRRQVMIMLRDKSNEYPVISHYDGFVRLVVVQVGKAVSRGDLLLIADVYTPNDFRVDEGDLNPHTELGGNGRRGVERDGERKFATEGYAAPLFDAPSKEAGMGQHSTLKQHPLTSVMKEGVPPKMSSDASSNDPAIKQLAEDAATDPELQAKLSNELKQELNITPGPTMGPTPRPM